MLTPWKESYEQPRQHIEKQRHNFANKCPSSQGYGFSSGHVWMWELDCEETWVPKNWCFWIVVLEKTLESSLDCKEIQPVHPKGDQCRVFIGRTDVEAETPILWPPDVKSWLIWKVSDAGKDWGQEEKGMTEDEMVGWHHWLNGHGFGWTSEAGDGQRGLVCSSSWGRKESDTTEQLNWTKLNTETFNMLYTYKDTMRGWRKEKYPQHEGVKKQEKITTLQFSSVRLIIKTVFLVPAGGRNHILIKHKSFIWPSPFCSQAHPGSLKNARWKLWVFCLFLFVCLFFSYLTSENPFQKEGK